MMPPHLSKVQKLARAVLAAHKQSEASHKALLNAKVNFKVTPVSKALFAAIKARFKQVEQMRSRLAVLNALGDTKLKEDDIKFTQTKQVLFMSNERIEPTIITGTKRKQLSLLGRRFTARHRRRWCRQRRSPRRHRGSGARQRPRRNDQERTTEIFFVKNRQKNKKTKRRHHPGTD